MISSTNVYRLYHDTANSTENTWQLPTDSLSQPTGSQKWQDLFPEKTIETLKRFDSLNLPKSWGFLSCCFLHPRLDKFIDNLRERSHVFSSLFQNHQKAHTNKPQPANAFSKSCCSNDRSPFSIKNYKHISCTFLHTCFSFISLANHGKLSKCLSPHLSKKWRWSRWWLNLKVSMAFQ